VLVLEKEVQVRLNFISVALIEILFPLEGGPLRIHISRTQLCHHIAFAIKFDSKSGCVIYPTDFFFLGIGIDMMWDTQIDFFFLYDARFL
jgi:hypothetical protein